MDGRWLGNRRNGCERRCGIPPSASVDGLEPAVHQPMLRLPGPSAHETHVHKGAITVLLWQWDEAPILYL